MNNIIHYCWLGDDKLDTTAEYCIKTWKKNFHNYEFILWNENNFDISKNSYVEEAYKQKKYAFVTDYVRLNALYLHGGIYFDTDFEVFRNFEGLFSKELLLSFQSATQINFAVIAATKKHPWIEEMLHLYEHLNFVKTNGTMDMTTNVDILTPFLQNKGIRLDNTLQHLEQCVIYPTEYFCPLDFETGQIKITDNTFGIHNFSGSWLESAQEKYFNLKRMHGRDYVKKTMQKQAASLTQHTKTGIKYSIVITYYNNPNILNLCLSRLIQSLDGYNNYEIIVVNDNPCQRIESIICPIMMIPLVKYKNLEQNLGYSGACNAGADIASGEFLIFLDSDAIVSDFWLFEMEKTAESNPDFGAIGACTLSLRLNTVEYFGMYLYGVDSIKPKFGNSVNFPFVSKDRECRIVTSTCMMISRKVFEQIGGFDKDLINSHCDLDLSLRLAPKKNYVSAKSKVFHRGGTSGDIRYSAYTKARSLFFQKWNDHKMDEETIVALKEMYSDYKGTLASTFYLLIDMSSTTNSDAYIQALQESLDISIIDTYRIRNSATSGIILEDYLGWDTCRLPTPILYFTDNFSLLTPNHHWFLYRKSRKDMIADFNGNIVQVASLLNQ